MDPFEIDQDDKYGQLRKPEGRTRRAKRFAKEKKREIVEKAIGKPKK